MNKQEIFGVVRAHLIEQSAKAEDLYTGACSYYAEDGKRCAVGALIPREVYTPDMEDSTVHVLVLNLEAPDTYATMMENDNSGLVKRTNALRSALVASGIDVTDIEVMRLLNDLQRVHDLHPVACWSEQLKRVADAYKLSAS